MDDNIFLFPGIVELEGADDEQNDNVPMDVLIDSLKEHDFKELVIIGELGTGTYFASTSGIPSDILWSLEKAKFILMSNYFELGNED